MKTLAELQKMSFIPHHECGCCGTMVGWYTHDQRPYFDPSCDCGCSGGHFDTWEDVFKWYNNVFEKESEDAVLEAWQKETIATESNMASEYKYICNIMDDFRYKISERLNALQYAINDCVRKDRLEFMCYRLNSLEEFVRTKRVVEMLENHKSNWIPNSKGGEPNCRRG